MKAMTIKDWIAKNKQDLEFLPLKAKREILHHLKNEQKATVPKLKKYNRILAFVSTFTVQTQDDALKLNLFGKRLQTAIKTAEAKKKELDKPYRIELKKILDTFNNNVDPVIDSITKIKSMLSDFKEAEIVRQQEEISKQKKKTSVVEQVLAAPKPKEFVKAAPVLRERKLPLTVIITNEILIPRKYLIVDKVELRRAGNANIKVPGVKFKQEYGMML